MTDEHAVTSNAPAMATEILTAKKRVCMRVSRARWSANGLDSKQFAHRWDLDSPFAALRLQTVAVKPDVPGIGVSEASAIVVQTVVRIVLQEDWVEVLGKAQIANYDPVHPKPAGDAPNITLRAGDQCDMKAHQVLTQCRPHDSIAHSSHSSQ